MQWWGLARLRILGDYFLRQCWQSYGTHTHLSQRSWTWPPDIISCHTLTQIIFLILVTGIVAQLKSLKIKNLIIVHFFQFNLGFLGFGLSGYPTRAKKMASHLWLGVRAKTEAKTGAKIAGLFARVTHAEAPPPLAFPSLPTKGVPEYSNQCWLTRVHPLIFHCWCCYRTDSVEYKNNTFLLTLAPKPSFLVLRRT